MPPAARVTDMHTCPMVTPGVPPIPHVGGPILPAGCPTVLIGMLPAARVSDMAMCVGPPDVIVKGSMTVIIGNMPAARMGDQTAHGGVIVMGEMTVMIGDSGSGSGGGGGGAGGGPTGRRPRELAPPGPGMSEDLASAFVLAAPIASQFQAAAESGAPFVDPNAISVPPRQSSPEENRLTETLTNPDSTEDERQEAADKLAELFTRNPDDSRVVLGPYRTRGGYIGEAEAHGGTYFQTSATFFDAIGRDPKLAWMVNEAFVRQQMRKGKPIVFTEDAVALVVRRPDSFSAREFDVIRSEGYRSDDGFVWARA